MDYPLRMDYLSNVVVQGVVQGTVLCPLYHALYHKHNNSPEEIIMGCLGNMIWFVLGGFLLGLFWLIFGVLWCLTIVGIPVGMQCFKFASLSFSPFGKEIEFSDSPVSLLLNILWLIFGGLEIAVTSAALGLVFCITVVGIPFGLQFFKIAKLALFPFGATIRT